MFTRDNVTGSHDKIVYKLTLCCFASHTHA